MIRGFLTQYPILTTEIITPVIMFFDIGMDIISKGNFIIENANNTTKFSFSMPPQQMFNFNTTFNNTIDNK